VLARGCGLSAILCGACHRAFEATVLPSWGALAAAIVVGIAPLAPANLAWDRGLRRGDSRLLAVMAYAMPLISADDPDLRWAGDADPQAPAGRADDHRRRPSLAQ
jgi:drug/metabolite transporter (DMT)-like permease